MAHYDSKAYTKQVNKNTKLWKQNGWCLDDVTKALFPIENWRKINMNF